MNKFLWMISALLLSGLAGCSTVNCGDSHPYTSSVAKPPLKAPPGLSVPAPDPDYAIQGLGQDQSKAAGTNGTCLVKPPQLVNTQPANASGSGSSSRNGPPEPAHSPNQHSTPSDNKQVTQPANASTVTPPVVAGLERVE
jgi:hypothetical protein